jgi:hypothetical protein
MSDPITVYIVKQRKGWSVELNGVVRSGHPTRDKAIAHAREAVTGREARIRIQEDAGAWREERSFSPKG